MVMSEQFNDLSLPTIQDIITGLQSSKLIEKILSRGIPYNDTIRTEGESLIVSIHISWRHLFESTFTIDSRAVSETPIKMYELFRPVVSAKRTPSHEIAFFMEYKIIRPKFDEKCTEDKSRAIRAYYSYAIDSLKQFSSPMWQTSITIQEKFAIIFEELHQGKSAVLNHRGMVSYNPIASRDRTLGPLGISFKPRRNPFYSKLAETLMAWCGEMGEEDRERIGKQTCAKVLTNTEDCEAFIKVAFVFLNSFYKSFRNLL